MENTGSNDWYGPEAATFGDRLAAAREAAGMTQKQLAKRLGVKLTTLSGWENDLSEPRANRLSMMAGILNVSIMWLLTGEGNGIAAPEDEEAIPPAINDLLVEIRDLKAQIGASADRLGRLEKKLRLTLKSGT
ncbi:helix-turn-helix domain-containing protein [Lutimaribacter sp. EGI FJ00015]|uniref:Helix-turn-helix domain-containing protein n=1 Tax=Lutimaribacter degradans TaxID=2945989 RepID=A0ACC5ZTV7_9RHOB|nr:helix-turn-helix transcriptional regulator [Lutimaribacter sp. EGI FJ00013]MCM2561378.1 helix-turn-helix domain-containing protein [Lutimaribacter sp. EGI FJ00013]MCO0612912.1 helix-turn-helix domain-containing protein [Lutimaribacter sp. EGI FJ00015]MCO0635570.1 helix-turn-helix domain-containing protein [Lutimaribacter sp. EGI FJ00014]